MSTHRLAAVLARMKYLTAAQTDADLSRALSVSAQTLSSWKVRDSIPYALCVELARQHGCSLDWLLLGEPPVSAAALDDTSWEADVLQRLRTLPHTDRQAILLFVQDKQRIQQLEQQLSELSRHLPAGAAG